MEPFRMTHYFHSNPLLGLREAGAEYSGVA